jgi:hypothetical protein
VGTADTSDGAEHLSVELWTTGQAAEFLSDLGITRRQVSRMVASGELPAMRRAPGKWAHIPAGEVHKLRAALLAQLHATRQDDEAS